MAAAGKSRFREDGSRNSRNCGSARRWPPTGRYSGLRLGALPPAIYVYVFSLSSPQSVFCAPRRFRANRYTERMK